MEPLAESAKEFFAESLANFEARKLNFAILHAVTAAELLLKARLATVHPNLIYKNLDSTQPALGMTIGLRALPNRLRNFGIALALGDEEVIRRVATWRHQIVHHVGDYSADVAETHLATLYEFLARFASDDLGLQLKDLVPSHLYDLADGLLTRWHDVLAAARQAALAEGRVYTEERCPSCGGVETVCLRDLGAFCHLCEKNLLCGECPVCHKTAVSQDEVHQEVFHSECLSGLAEGIVQDSLDARWDQY